MRNASRTLVLTLLVVLAAGAAIAQPVWEDFSLLSLDESAVPFAEYPYYEYEALSGIHSIPGDLGDNRIVRVGVVQPQHVDELEGPFAWNSNPGNSDYGVWLNEDGSADLVWNRGGQYAFQIERQSGEVSTEFVLGDCFLTGDWFSPSTLAHLAGYNNRTSFTPGLDLAIVADQSDTSNKRLRDEANIAGIPTVEAKTPQQAADAIEATAQGLGRKINIAMVGHGASGNFYFAPEGTKSTGSNTIALAYADTGGECPGVDAYMKAVQDHVSQVGFVSCSTGAGTVGQELLDYLYRRMGGNGVSWAYDTQVITGWRIWGAYNSTYWIADDGKRVYGTVPEPSSLLALGSVIVGLGLLRTRRRSPAG